MGGVIIVVCGSARLRAWDTSAHPLSPSLAREYSRCSSSSRRACSASLMTILRFETHAPSGSTSAANYGRTAHHCRACSRCWP